MGLLNTLTNAMSNYGDDIVRAASNSMDDVARAAANQTDDTLRAAMNQIDDSAKSAKKLLTPEQQKYFQNSVIRDADGNLKTLYHGSPRGKFTIFNKELASPESDWGRGFYFTDNEDDVIKNYFGGGPDFDNKIARLAEQYEGDLDIPYDLAKEKAKNDLFKGAYKIDAYANMENPATVGKTFLFDGSEYPVRALADYDNIDDYYSDLIYELADDVIADTNIDYEYADKIRALLGESVWDGGIGLQEMKNKINDLFIEDYDGNLVSNDVARSILENLGFDGIIDPTVANKFNMSITPGTTHYIAFNPNQIKHIKNVKPTINPDIFLGISGLLGGGAILGNLLNNGKNQQGVA